MLLHLILALATATAPAAAPDPAGTSEIQDERSQGRFVYLDGEGKVTLRASSMYGAVLGPRNAERGTLASPPDGLELDPRSSRPDLLARGVTLFRVPSVVAPRGLEAPPLPDAWQSTLGSQRLAQPVFEKGAVLRIPSDEVVLAFAPSTTREQAKGLLSDAWDDIEASELYELRAGTFVCVLENPGVGRAFPVSRVLSELEGVFWAEPVFINIYLETPGGPPQVPALPLSSEFISHRQTIQARPGGSPVTATERAPSGFEWDLLIDGHFEGNVDQWMVGRDMGSSRILPWVTRDRAHDGNRSVHMSGQGLDGARPPDPYGSGAGSWLISPPFIERDFTGQIGPPDYVDAFVELWFWAELEDPQDAPRQVRDFGHVLLYDMYLDEFVFDYPIVPVGSTGDLAGTPGTELGWRKLLFRLPDARKIANLQLLVHFYSDGEGEREGLYVDDVRVLATRGPSRPPGSRDPQAERQYAIHPTGQIAGRPDRRDPRVHGAAAWPHVLARRDVIVALLDDGVDRGHPDLAFWEPVRDSAGRHVDEQAALSSADEDAEPADEIEAEQPAGEEPQGHPITVEDLYPGEPVSPADRHGTACAGVLGAIANNGLGSAGVAPGALLLPLRRGVDDLSVVRAVDAAVDYGAHVLVIPWGWSEVSPAVVRQAIHDAIEAGMVVVAAAGDGVHRPYSDEIDFPCSLGAETSLLCVGASGIAGEPKGVATADGLYWWASAASATGPDLLAPGTWLHATDLRGPPGYSDGDVASRSDWTAEFSGTGAAACYAAGVASLMLSLDPPMSPEEAKRLITASATKLRVSTHRRSGYHLLAPERAMMAAMERAAQRRAFP